MKAHPEMDFSQCKFNWYFVKQNVVIDYQKSVR